jgi:hypothetical protein
VRTRKVKYAESDDEDEDVLKQVDGNGNRRASKRRKVSPESDDEFGIDAETEEAMMEIGRFTITWQSNPMADIPTHCR